MDQYEIFCNLRKQSKGVRSRSPNKSKNLKFLNELIIDLHGQLLMELYGDDIHKIKPGLVKRVIHTFDGEKIAEHQEYGHIRIKKNIFRISSCLFENNTVQYPVQEQRFFHKGTYFYFTDGDLFLIVDLSKILLSDHLRKTKHQNYEINVSSLFKLNAVEHFGLINFNTFSFNDGQQIIKINKTLPEKFMKYSLRGCCVADDPHYILGRIENSGSLKYFDYELWTNYKDIYFKYPSGNKQPGAVSRQARKNTDRILNKEKYYNGNITTRRPGFLTKNKDCHFLIFDYQKINDLETIRDFCHRNYLKYADRIR